MSEKKFNIRVYGLLINDKNEILVSDESRAGFFFTKFPGGGLEWGEGIKDCLVREFQEELGIQIEVGELFYCTDFFVESAFKNTDQLISIYYKVNYNRINELNFANLKSSELSNDEQFRWISLKTISQDEFTFPIDKLVAKKLKELQEINGDLQTITKP